MRSRSLGSTRPSNALPVAAAPVTRCAELMVRPVYASALFSGNPAGIMLCCYGV
ncbi:MAG: hypothetical protein ACJ780_23675 [Solirubrobacteraceae bacterium]